MKKSFSITVNNNHTFKTAQYIKDCGGNAFDMAIALQLVACVTEPLLTGIGGSGIAMCKRRYEDAALYIDFFSTMPSIPLNDLNHPKEIEIDFGESKQTFHIDCGAIATPTLIDGLRHIHKNFASLPWHTLVQGAVEVSTMKIPLRTSLKKILSILNPIVSYNRELYEIFYNDKSVMYPSFLYASKDDYLEIQKDPDNYWKNKSQSITDLQSKNSRLKLEDILNYKVTEHKIAPIRINSNKYYLPDFPSYSGHQLRKKLNEESFFLNTDVQHLEELWLETKIQDKENFLRDNIMPTSAGNTSHISIVDSDGNSISMTTSLGESCGLFLPNTRILMNNFLGESDVTLDIAHNYNKTRLLTMCCPSIFQNNSAVVAFGAAGSSRIRSIILQAIRHLNKDIFSSDIEDNFLQYIVEKPRLHFDAAGLHMEQGHYLQNDERIYNHNVTLHNPDNLFFGCLNIAALVDKKLYFGADKRREAVGYLI